MLLAHCKVETRVIRPILDNWKGQTCSDASHWDDLLHAKMVVEKAMKLGLTCPFVWPFDFRMPCVILHADHHWPSHKHNACNVLSTTSRYIYTFPATFALKFFSKAIATCHWAERSAPASVIAVWIWDGENTSSEISWQVATMLAKQVTYFKSQNRVSIPVILPPTVSVYPEQKGPKGHWQKMSHVTMSLCSHLWQILKLEKARWDFGGTLFSPNGFFEKLFTKFWKAASYTVISKLDNHSIYIIYPYFSLIMVIIFIPSGEIRRSWNRSTNSHGRLHLELRQESQRHLVKLRWFSATQKATISWGHHAVHCRSI